MNYKIVVDSSSDLLVLDGVDFASVPLKIQAGDREFVDNAELDVAEMTAFLKQYTGRSGTACPSAGEWMDAFGEAEHVFCITITSNLSGSYNAAMVAKEEYESAHPGRRVGVLDSLSTGPEMGLMAYKVKELVEQGEDFDAVCEKVRAYAQSVELLFTLGSLNNLANNGRINPAVAKVCGVLGIRIVGKATDGRLDPQHKCRGEKRSIQQMVTMMQELGYKGGKVRISHCMNPDGAEATVKAIRAQWPDATVEVGAARGLDCFYAEVNGLLVAIET